MEMGNYVNQIYTTVNVKCDMQMLCLTGIVSITLLLQGTSLLPANQSSLQHSQWIILWGAVETLQKGIMQFASQVFPRHFHLRPPHLKPAKKIHLLLVIKRYIWGLSVK